MTDFTVTITDEAELAGITWSREQYNERAPMLPNGQPSGTPIETDEAYMQFVMGNAAKSYVIQKSKAP